jgi:hypothetical protein
MRFLPGRRIRRLGVVGALGLLFAASGYAYVCHPDAPGTRRLAVAGRVDDYALSGARVTVAAWVEGCERRIVWRPLASTSRQGGCGSAHVGGAAPRLTASDGRYRVVLRKGSAVPDRPDRLAVYDSTTGAGLHVWPLPAPAASVDLARGTAILSTSNGVYAVRVSDGQFALVGVKRPGDHAQVDASGVVFQDDLYKRRSRARSLLKFVPFATVARMLRPFGPLHTPEPIGDFSIDGRSVIFVKRDPTGSCDRIGVWTIPWHYSTDLMDEPPICPEQHAPGGVTALALSGQFVEVVTTYGKVQTLISSTFVHCIEKVVARTRLGTARIRGVAGDGGTLAYAVNPTAAPGRVGLLSGQRLDGSTELASPAVGLSVDRGVLAALRADGRVDVVRRGRVLRTFEPTGARAIALRAGELTVLTRGRTLDVYALASGRLLHRWPVPAGTAPAVDVHYGVAVVTAGRRLLVVSLATGRRRVLLTAPRPVRAHLDDIGVVYVYNSRQGGVVGFVPFAQVERALASR